MACVFEACPLWPAALARWADAAYLHAELEDVSCAVLSTPLDLKRFSYWLPNKSFRTPDGARGRYRFDEPA
eukprot:3616861-Prymnesium_polylepis.1